MALLLAYLAPPLVLICLGLCAVARRRSGKWRVHYPQQDGTGRIVGKYWLLKQYAERDR